MRYMEIRSFVYLFYVLRFSLFSLKIVKFRQNSQQNRFSTLLLWKFLRVRNISVSILIPLSKKNNGLRQLGTNCFFSNFFSLFWLFNQVWRLDTLILFVNKKYPFQFNLRCPEGLLALPIFRKFCLITCCHICLFNFTYLKFRLLSDFGKYFDIRLSIGQGMLPRFHE